MACQQLAAGPLVRHGTVFTFAETRLMLELIDRSLLLALAVVIEAAIAYPDALFRAIGHPVSWIGARDRACSTAG